MRTLKLSAIILVAAIFLPGCAGMSLTGNAKNDGISTRTKVLGGGAVATGVGLVAIPFAGPALAAAAIWSYEDDAANVASGNQKGAKAVAADKRKECKALYKEAAKEEWSSFRTAATALVKGCEK
ncbi:hypothetical protein A3I99_02810 [Candidatus Kaiserbacteria bacterium RIFCSPLOWO2_02_FULL_45_11b]|uniref:Lipoprotein n=1 Tax=Candidatus Kaiserbacteria bacterium RIFCSPLOWO2_12_FULL_45_26 TaxID=1798525 RepID=A0A1F6FFF4_9BACT|nr:MAG: hypothetical protein A2929_04555 [Candidatus Kaiserbacteria bacterium RIFCSPLOWO2_01_FULL_45_25]OGG81978.1 MAG: hypothetical protein A3I99_02810 [Candidatus Kaiserbacteria bacterium RIFCSPLOWO2_02_FULL_45_11b]OGG84574.1 MAG: hypothetical protein A3G90_00600 [Candidatus Kaiserbacteria bacterium RIFCSPLOWO2_12_FULL_45_26]